MNAAAKVMEQGSLFQGGWSGFHINKMIILPCLLLVLVLCSALSVVYLINIHRVTCSQLQKADNATHQLELEWGQLLLEQASLAAPARIERLATQKLHMSFPLREQTFILSAG